MGPKGGAGRSFGQEHLQGKRLDSFGRDEIEHPAQTVPRHKLGVGRPQQLQRFE